MGNIFKKNKSKKVLEPSDEYFCYRSCLDDEWIRKQKLEKIIHTSIVSDILEKENASKSLRLKS